MRVRGMVLAVLALVLGAGCTATGGSRTRSSRDTLTRTDLENTMQVTAFEAVRQARPSWLRVRGPNSIHANNPILVYVDGARAGGVEALRSIPVISIERVRFYDPPEAQARFGLNHTNGAIEVITRRGS